MASFELAYGQFLATVHDSAAWLWNLHAHEGTQLP